MWSHKFSHQSLQRMTINQPGRQQFPSTLRVNALVLVGNGGEQFLVKLQMRLRLRTWTSKRWIRSRGLILSLMCLLFQTTIRANQKPANRMLKKSKQQLQRENSRVWRIFPPRSAGLRRWGQGLKPHAPQLLFPCRRLSIHHRVDNVDIQMWARKVVRWFVNIVGKKCFMMVGSWNFVMNLMFKKGKDLETLGWLVSWCRHLQILLAYKKLEIGFTKLLNCIVLNASVVHLDFFDGEKRRWRWVNWLQRYAACRNLGVHSILGSTSRSCWHPWMWKKDARKSWEHQVHEIC